MTPYSQPATDRIVQMQAYFISRGADAGTALQRAYAAVHGLVQREAAFLSFVDAFYLLGVIFLLMIPLLFLMRRPDKLSGAPAPAVVD